MNAFQSITFNGTSDPEGCRALTEDLVDSPLCAEQGYRQCFRGLLHRLPNNIDYTVSCSLPSLIASHNNDHIIRLVYSLELISIVDALELRLLATTLREFELKTTIITR